MSKPSQHPPYPTLPLAGRVAQLAAKPRSGAREGGGTSRSLAKTLRANHTLSELRMWRLLHALRTNGYHFRKQVKLGPNYVDFACLHAKLVIEVDGITHDSDAARENDALRDDYLKSRGFTVLRFFAYDVLDNGAGVGEMTLAALDGKPRNYRGSPPPSRAALGRSAPSSATLPAKGEGDTSARGTMRQEPQNPPSPSAGRVAQLAAQPPSEAREGGEEPRSPAKKPDENWRE
jgi:very-short-patch-repair endonuclease